MRGLAISMTSEGATERSKGCVNSRLRLQHSLAELGRSTMLCSGRACGHMGPAFTSPEPQNCQKLSATLLQTRCMAEVPGNLQQIKH